MDPLMKKTASVKFYALINRLETDQYIDGTEALSAGQAT